MDKRILDTMNALKRNNMMPFFVQNRAEALERVKKLLTPGEVVSHGGSVTLQQCGVIDLLKNGEYQYLDRTAVKDPREVYIATFSADTFITSTNAITLRGELYNVDGNSNRIAAIAYGPKQVIVIVGINKLVTDLDDAAQRVKAIAAPRNVMRLNCETYCKKSGSCVSMLSGATYVTDGCMSSERICCNYLISAKQRVPERIKVIIVNENLGY